MSRVGDALRGARGWALGSEGSTRPAALLRISLALVLWARFAGELALYRLRSPAEVALALVFFAVSTLMLVGLWARLAAALTAATMIVLFYGFGLYGGKIGWLHHHTYLLMWATILCALSPCGRSLGVDRWRALRRAERGGSPAPPERANLWAMRLCGLQLVVLYLASALDKTDLAFLGGDRLEAILLWTYVDAGLTASPWLRLAAIGGSWFVVAMEYALGLGLLHPRARRWLLWPGLAMHAGFYVLVPVSTFSVTVACLYLAVLDPDAVHRVSSRLVEDRERGD
jgi:uncharacterized membrane protein YidH (DUF202 family)